MRTQDKHRTQLEWVRSELNENGCVSRNKALSMRFTRLAGRVNDLKKMGWIIEGKQVGSDYLYFHRKNPSQLVINERK